MLPTLRLRNGCYAPSHPVVRALLTGEVNGHDKVGTFVTLGPRHRARVRPANWAWKRSTEVEKIFCELSNRNEITCKLDTRKFETLWSLSSLPSFVMRCRCYRTKWVVTLTHLILQISEIGIIELKDPKRCLFESLWMADSRPLRAMI